MYFFYSAQGLRSVLTSSELLCYFTTQVLSQEILATLMTGMLAQTGSLGQPLLIPISMAGSIGGQGGLAVFTLPTTNVATLSGLAAAATQTANLLKLPFAGLQGNDHHDG